MTKSSRWARYSVIAAPMSRSRWPCNLCLRSNELLILIEYEGMTLEEAAQAVAAEEGTVKARLHRARQNLRRMLEPLRSALR